MLLTIFCPKDSTIKRFSETSPHFFSFSKKIVVCSTHISRSLLFFKQHRMYQISHFHHREESNKVEQTNFYDSNTSYFPLFISRIEFQKAASRMLGRMENDRDRFSDSREASFAYSPFKKETYNFRSA